MARHCLSVATKFALRCRALSQSCSSSRGLWRLDGGGITLLFPACCRGVRPRAAAASALSAMLGGAFSTGLSAAAPSSSWPCPGVRGPLSGWPSASPVGWSFVGTPPVLRPMASCLRSPRVPQRCADAHGRLGHHAWRLHGRCPPPDRSSAAPPPRLQPIACTVSAPLSLRQSVPAHHATVSPPGHGRAPPRPRPGAPWRALPHGRHDRAIKPCAAPMDRPVTPRVCASSGPSDTPMPRDSP